MDLWLDVIVMFMACANASWLFSAGMLYALKGSGNPDFDNTVIRAVRWIFHEVKPFFRAFAVITTLVHIMPLSAWCWLDLVVLAVQFWFFHIYKDADDDDDRWKRRKQKVLDKITITDGKLAVIPA